MNPLCLLSYTWHCPENQRRVSVFNCYSSLLVFIYQSHTLERHFSPQWTSKLTVTRLAVSSYFFSLRIQRVIHSSHTQSKLRVQFRVPHEKTSAFSPPWFTCCSRAIIPKLHWHKGDNLDPFPWPVQSKNIKHRDRSHMGSFWSASSFVPLKGGQVSHENILICMWLHNKHKNKMEPSQLRHYLLHSIKIIFFSSKVGKFLYKFYKNLTCRH